MSENDDLPFDPYYCIATGEETEHQDERNSPQATALTAVKLESSDDQDGQPEAEEHNHSEEKSDSKDAKRRKKYKKRTRSSSSYSHRDRRRKQRKKKERWVRLPSSSSERTRRGRPPTIDMCGGYRSIEKVSGKSRSQDWLWEIRMDRKM